PRTDAAPRSLPDWLGQFRRDTRTATGGGRPDGSEEVVSASAPLTAFRSHVLAAQRCCKSKCSQPGRLQARVQPPRSRVRLELGALESLRRLHHASPPSLGLAVRT